jgi:hypothetical protein
MRPRIHVFLRLITVTVSLALPDVALIVIRCKPLSGEGHELPNAPGFADAEPSQYVTLTMATVAFGCVGRV